MNCAQNTYRTKIRQFSVCFAFVNWGGRVAEMSVACTACVGTGAMGDGDAWTKMMTNQFYRVLLASWMTFLVVTSPIFMASSYTHLSGYIKQRWISTFALSRSCLASWDQIIAEHHYRIDRPEWATFNVIVILTKHIVQYVRHSHLFVVVATEIELYYDGANLIINMPRYSHSVMRLTRSFMMYYYACYRAIIHHIHLNGYRMTAIM